MTRHAREAISLAGAAAIGEAALVAFTTTERALGANALLIALLVGSLLLLALAAWRGRAHPTRSQVLFWVAVAVAAGGLAVLGTAFYRYNESTKVRKSLNTHGMIVAGVQWGVVLAAWLWLVVQEVRERRATKNRAQRA